VVAQTRSAPAPQLANWRAGIDAHFAEADSAAIVQALRADGSAWAAATLATLQKRSPLMTAVTLEQIRRARDMSLPECLRLERDLMRHALHRPDGLPAEAIEGIRALAIDKDLRPRWNPSRTEDVDPALVRAFFDSPWPRHAHPLRLLDQRS
jgi:enoyl-CoA hydratase